MCRSYSKYLALPALMVLMSTACLTPKIKSSGQAPAIPVSHLSITVLEDCANGHPRTAWGTCPAVKLCSKLCILGALPEKENSCWNHPDYSTQLDSDGLPCAWTFVPREYKWTPPAGLYP